MYHECIKIGIIKIDWRMRGQEPAQYIKPQWIYYNNYVDFWKQRYIKEYINIKIVAMWLHPGRRAAGDHVARRRGRFAEGLREVDRSATNQRCRRNRETGSFIRLASSGFATTCVATPFALRCFCSARRFTSHRNRAAENKNDRGRAGHIARAASRLSSRGGI